MLAKTSLNGTLFTGTYRPVISGIAPDQVFFSSWKVPFFSYFSMKTNVVVFIRVTLNICFFFFFLFFVFFFFCFFFCGEIRKIYKYMANSFYLEPCKSGKHWIASLFCKGVFSKRKEFAPKRKILSFYSKPNGANSFLLE